LGKPRTSLLGADKDNDNTQLEDAELMVWRAGMKSMANDDNVYVKISMLGYVIPGWIRVPERVELMESLVKETDEMFGPKSRFDIAREITLSWDNHPFFMAALNGHRYSRTPVR
jgi:hypothetical protein